MISVLCIGWFLYPFSISSKLIKRVFYFYESTICTLLDAYDYDRLINNFLTKCLRNSNNDLVAVLLHKSTFLCIILFFYLFSYASSNTLHTGIFSDISSIFCGYSRDYR